MSKEPPPAITFYNRGCDLQREQCWEAAIDAYERALEFDPNFAAAYSNRGAALTSMNRCVEALASLDRAIGLKPDYAEAHFCRAIALLMRGDLAEGWQEFEWRWQTAPGRALRLVKDFSPPLWIGEQTVAGKSVLLYAERGLGDTLQFCRYALQVAQLRAKVILQVQAPLLPVLQSLSRDIQVVGETEPLPRFDFQCPLLTLPFVFKTSEATIPAPRRYLSADVSLLERAKSATRDASSGALHVGLVWRGDANNPDDRDRSIPLQALLAGLPRELHYFSLQKELAQGESEVIQSSARFTYATGELNFAATAALCECVDVVVAIDTSVAHLAAALGARTWILLPFNADCRWMLEREDSPWYPTAKLYRQSNRGDWQDVLARVHADLRRLARAGRSL